MSTCLASPPPGWAVTSAVRAPALRAISTSVCAVGRSPGPADCDVAAHVKEAHGEAAHLQSFAPKPEDDDALRGDDGLDEPVQRVLRHSGEHVGKIAQGALRQLGQALGHRVALAAQDRDGRAGDATASRSDFKRERN